MTAAHHATPSAPAPDDLVALAGLVDRLGAERPGSLLCQVSGVGAPDGPGGRAARLDRDDEVELRLLPLGEAHPLAVLVGWRAPASCDALAVRAPGRGRRLDGCGRTRGATHPLVVTLVLDRWGREATLLRHPDRVEPVPGPVTGLVADACRRALGLPTEPPPGATAHPGTAPWP